MEEVDSLRGSADHAQSTGVWLGALDAASSGCWEDDVDALVCETGPYVFLWVWLGSSVIDGNGGWKWEMGRQRPIGSLRPEVKLGRQHPIGSLRPTKVARE